MFRLTTLSKTLALLALIVSVASAQWQPTNGPTGGAVLTLAGNGEQVFASTDGGGLFVTRDGGDHWSHLPFSEWDERISAFFCDSSAIIISTFRGIYLSKDAGLSWKLIHSKDVYAFTAKGTKLFASRYNEILYSLDHGEHWYFVGKLPVQQVNALTATAAGIFAGTDQGVFFSRDDGEKWQAMNNGLGKQKAVTAFALSGTRLYAGTAYDGVYRSNNNGSSWLPTSLSGEPVYTLVAKGDNLFAACYSGLYLTTNMGVNWRTIGFKESAVTALAIAGTRLYTAIKAAGVFVSADNGETWSESNHGIANTEVRALAANGATIYAQTKDGHLWLTRDQGETWLPWSIKDKVCTALAVHDSVIYVATNGGIFYSADDGSNWQNFANSSFFFSPRCLVFADSLMLAGADGAYVTTDRCKTWNNSEPLMEILTQKNVLITAAVILDSTIFIGTYGAGIFCSTDTGKTWTQPGENSSVLTVYAFTRVKSTLLAGTWGTFVASSDKGEHWNSVLNDVQNVQSLATVDANVFAGLLDGGVILSNDGGGSWKYINNGLNQSTIYAIAANDSDVYIGTAHGGVWRRPLKQLIKSTPGK